jgi:DNA-binding transcriptional regulator YhcF (GntR family)
MTRPAPTEPPYARIAAEIRRRIAAGELRAGDRVPSTRQIADEWSVAIATATRALSLLAQEGVLRAVPRVGTVVATPEVAPPVTRRRVAREPDQEPTAARVVRAAIEIADAEGLAALSMRGVAARLDVATMSLYRYVQSKDDLVLLMTDAVFGEEKLPDRPPHGWRPRLELAARQQWAAYRRHPWLAHVVSLMRPVTLPNLLPHAEWSLAAIDGLGLDAVTMLHVHITMYSYVRGIAVNFETAAQAQAETGLTDEEWMDAQSAEYAAIAATGRYPTFSRIVDEVGRTEHDVNLDRIFEFGLGPLLDGLAALIERAPAHRGRAPL